jgi:RNA ligase
MDDIILLAVIDTDTGLETDSIDNYRDVLSVTKHYDGIIDWKTIREEFDGENREGFVVRFSNGFRMKLKYEQYFKIHFLRSMISKKFILEHIIDNTLHEIADIINELDEENQIYYHNIIDELYKRYNDINDDVNRMYRPSTEFESQKDYAAWVLTLDKYSAMIFSKDKGKDYSRFIWKLIKNETKESPSTEGS